MVAEIVYDLAVHEAQEGESHRVVIVWGEDGKRVLTSTDVYGGADAFSVDTVHDLEPADATMFPPLPRDLPPGELLTTTDGGMEGEPERILSARANGIRVDDCPTTGAITSFFRTGSDDVSRSWVVIHDEAGTPRVAYAASAR
ncbi:MAG: hypothetical protein ACJ762_04985 [Solirubrobacteraceae bacterium]